MAGMPTRKMRPKRPATIKNELACLKPLRMYFGNKQAAAVALADCDGYRDWRLSGGFSPIARRMSNGGKWRA
jgi:hypothetical protein